MEQMPAGFYTDPDDATRMRWWDGAAWTEVSRPLVAGELASAMPLFDAGDALPRSGFDAGALRREAARGSVRLLATGVVAILVGRLAGLPLTLGRALAALGVAVVLLASWRLTLRLTDGPLPGFMSRARELDAEQLGARARAGRRIRVWH